MRDTYTERPACSGTRPMRTRRGYCLHFRHRLQLMPVRRRKDYRQPTGIGIHPGRRRKWRASWSSACKRLHQETVAKRPSREIPYNIQPRCANHSRKSISHPTAESLACKPHTIFVREQEKPGDTDVAEALFYAVFPAQYNDIPTLMVTDTCYRRCGSTLRKRDKRDRRKPWTINWQHSGKPYGRTYRIS